MNSSTLSSRTATALRVEVTEDTLSVELSDGRTIAGPLAWYPRLVHGTVAERIGGVPSDKAWVCTGPTSMRISVWRTCWRAGPLKRARLRCNGGFSEDRWPRSKRNPAPALQLAGLLQLRCLAPAQYRRHGLGQEGVKGGGLEVGRGMGGDGDLLHRTGVCCDFDPRGVAEHGCRALVEGDEIERVFQRARLERVAGDKEAEGDDPLAQGCRVEEGEAVFFLTLGAVDPHHAALRPFGRGEAAGPQLLDAIDDQLENPAVPARGAAVAGDAIAGMPLAAVDLPGGLG